MAEFKLETVPDYEGVSWGALNLLPVSEEEEFRHAEDNRMLNQARGELDRAGANWKQQGWAVLEQIRTGIESRIQRTAGSPGLTDQDNQADRLARMENAMSQAIAERDPEGFKGFALRSARGAAVTLPEMVVEGATLGPYGAIMGAVSQESNQAITEGKDAGLSGGELARYVAAQGAVEALPAVVMQRLGLGGLESAVGRQAVSKGVMNGLKRAGIQTLQELPEEIVTELGHSLTGALAGTRPDALKPEQLMQTIADTVGQTLVTMGLVETPQIRQAAIVQRQRAQKLAQWKQGGSATQAITGVQDNAVEGIAALDAPPGAHKWAEIVLGDRKRFKEAPDEATRQKQWEDIQQEISDAEKVYRDQGGPTETGQVGQGGEVDRRGDVYQGGQVEESPQPTGEVATAPEVPVAPESPDVAELNSMSPEALAEIYQAVFPDTPMPESKDDAIRQIVEVWGGKREDTAKAASDLAAFSQELAQQEKPSAATTTRMAGEQDTGAVSEQGVQPVEPGKGGVARPTVPPNAPAPTVSETAADAGKPEGRKGLNVFRGLRAGKSKQDGWLWWSPDRNYAAGYGDDSLEHRQVDETRLLDLRPLMETNATISGAQLDEEAQGLADVFGLDQDEAVEPLRLWDVLGEDADRLGKFLEENGYQGMRWFENEGEEAVLLAPQQSPAAPQTPVSAETTSGPPQPAETQQETPQKPQTPSAPDYSGMKGKELAAEAKKRGLKGFGGKKKDALRAMLEEDDRKRAAPPRTVGARKATPEGLQRVEAAKERLREIVNNKDLTGKTRADAIANGKALVGFLTATADTRKPLDTDYRNGDQIAYTGVTTPDGFREFIYLEGSKAGQYGQAMTEAEVAANRERKATSEAQLQEGFRRLRETTTEPTPAAETQPDAAQEAADAIQDMDTSTVTGERKAMQAVADIAQKHGLTPNELWRDVYYDIEGGARDIESILKSPLPKTKGRPVDKPDLSRFKDEAAVKEAYQYGKLSTGQAIEALDRIRAAAKESTTPEPIKPPLTSQERWDSAKLGKRIEWLQRAGWTTAKGQLSKRAERWAEQSWNKLSPASRNALESKIAEDYPRIERETEKKKEVAESTAPAAEKQPWEMTKEEFTQKYPKTSDANVSPGFVHRHLVTQAVAEGKPVPDFNLVAYNLKPPTAPAAAPVSETAAETQPDAVQEPESAAEVVSELPEQTTATMEAGEIQKVPTKEIGVDPDRFQFKGGHNRVGVVEGEELAGEWNPTAAGVILLWEDKDGKKWAVNGHHRVDLANRLGVPAMDARVVREVDGITQDRARAMGAELNILEGQGTIDDYAQFFRETKIPEEEARQGGLLGRSKGKTGFLVGSFASDDVWAAFRAGRISADKAAAIADVGRDDEAIQMAGLSQARQGGSADQLRSFLQALKMYPREKSRQGNLFGFDDSAMVEADKISKAVTRIVGRLKDRLLAVRGALKRPETAKEMGLSGDYDSIQKEVDQIQEDLARWDKWTTDPELFREARREAGLREKPQSGVLLPEEGERIAKQDQAAEFEAGRWRGEPSEASKQGKMFADQDWLPDQQGLFDVNAPAESAAESAQRRAEESRPEGTAWGAGPGGGQVSMERIRDDEIPVAIRAPQEQERRLRNAKGMRKPSLMDRVKETIQHLKNVTRAQEHIPNTGEFGPANEFFRLLRNVPSMAQDEAVRTTAAIADPLGPKQIQLFERYTIMENLAASIKVGQPLRFGFKSAKEVENYLSQLQDVVNRVPAVQEAIETRRKIVKETTDKLVEYDLLPEAAKENTDTYYHQQVHFYMVAHGMKGGGTRAGKVGRSFQKRRVLGEELADEAMDYNTSYLEAEISWLTDAYMEIEKERLLRQLMDKYDTKPELKERAKRQNFEKVVGGPEIANRIDQILGELAESRESEDAQDSAERMRRKQLIEELEQIDPTHPYRRQIAKMAGWFRNEHGIDEAYEDWYGEVDDNQFWKMVKEYADQGDVPALAFFKALHEREAFIRDRLGKDYATWETLAEQAEGMEIFQPEPGNQFYRAFTIPERIVEQLQENAIQTAELNADDLRQVLAMAGPRRQFVVPSEIAAQLAETRKGEAPHGLAKVADEMMRSWKVYTLLNPKRAVAYNLRNVTGDIDPVIAADPTLLKHADRAMRELTRYHQGRLQLTPELRTARDLGVIGSGFVAEEVPDIKDLAVFRRFVSESGKTSTLLRPVKGYMDIVKPLSQWREDTLRYAAFLGYREQLRKGRVKHYGGSKKAVVQQIKRDMGVDAAAAHLARNLLGDYGNISVAGNWIRRRLMPFWSFQEINLKRVPRLLVNAYESGGTMRTAGTLSAAAGRAILMSRVAWMFAALWLWNRLIQGGDEEDELAGYDRAVPHIILGRNPDGSIRTFRRVGALGDFLEWFGINEAVAMLGKHATGQVSTSDILKEMAFATPEKVMDSMRPDLKALYEIPTGQTLFPEPFQPRSVRRDEAVSNIFGLTDEYKWMKGWVLGDGNTARPYYWQRWIVGVTDPRHAALSQAYELRKDFLKQKGKEEKGVFPVSRYKEARDAAKFEDYDAFVAWKRNFVMDKGDKAKDDFKDWLGTLDPVANRLNDSDEIEFEQKFLTNEQRQRLTVARNYAYELRDLLVTWWDADERSKEMKTAVVFSAFNKMNTTKPVRKDYDSDAKFQAAMDKFTTTNERAANDIKSMVSSHAEAQQLLVESYRKPNSEGKMQTEINASDTTKFDASYWGDAKNPGKAKILAKLYGYSDPAAAVLEFRQSPEFKAWLAEWNRKRLTRSAK